MSNASRWYPVAKSYQDHQGLQSEQLGIVVTFQDGISVSSNQRLRVLWLTASPQFFQIARVENFPNSLSFYSCVTMGRESNIHNACSVPCCACFQSSDETWCIVTRDVHRGGEQGDDPGNLTTMGAHAPKPRTTRTSDDWDQTWCERGMSGYAEFRISRAPVLYLSSPATMYL